MSSSLLVEMNAIFFGQSRLNPTLHQKLFLLKESWALQSPPLLFPPKLELDLQKLQHRSFHFEHQAIFLGCVHKLYNSKSDRKLIKKWHKVPKKTWCSTKMGKKLIRMTKSYRTCQCLCSQKHGKKLLSFNKNKK